MKLIILSLSLFLFASLSVSAQTNAVCPDPAKPCHHKSKKFDEWELSFKMPVRLAANKTYKSVPFYAVILKQYDYVEDCDGGEFVIAEEADRKRVQKMFPDKKVFVDYQCPNMGPVDYDFEGRRDSEQILISNFIAVYAGADKASADAILAKVKAKYPDAMIKKMTVAYERIVQ